jgi:hypothetical protein
MGGFRADAAALGTEQSDNQTNAANLSESHLKTPS